MIDYFLRLDYVKSLISLLLLLSASTASAQHSYGAELGLTFPWAQRPDYSYYKSTTGKAFKINYAYTDDWLCIKGTIGFLEKGFNQHLIFVDTSGNVLGEGDVERHRFSYLEAAIKAGYTVGDKFKFQALAGVQFAHYLQTHVHLGEVTLDNGDTYPGYNLTFSNLQRPDLAANVELNFGLRVIEDSYIFLISEYSHGLINIKYRDQPTPSPWKNHYFSVRIGLITTINYEKNKTETESRIEEEI